MEEERQGADIVFAVQVAGDVAGRANKSGSLTRKLGQDDMGIARPQAMRCAASLRRRGARESGKDGSRGRPSDLKYMAQAVGGVGLVALDEGGGACFGMAQPHQSAPDARPGFGAEQRGRRPPDVDVKTKLAVGGVGVAGKIVTVAVGGITQMGKTASEGTRRSQVPAAAVPALTWWVPSSTATTMAAASVTGSFRSSRVIAKPRRPEPVRRDADWRCWQARRRPSRQEGVNFAVNGPAGPLTI